MKYPIYIIVMAAILVGCNSNNNKPSNTATAASTEKTTNSNVLDTSSHKPVMLTHEEANMLAYANKLCKKGRFEEGIKLFDSVLKTNPKNSYAIAGKAGADFTLGNLDKAKQECEQSLQIDGRNILALYTRAQIMQYYNNFSQALTDYNLAIGINPEYANAYTGRAITESSMGDVAAAKRDFAMSLKLVPYDPSTYYSRGVFYGMLGMPDSEMLDYRMALKLYPKYESAILNMGVVRLKQRKDYAGALSDFTHVIKINKANQKAWYLRAKTKRELKDYKGAIADLNEALKLDPTYKNALLQRSEVYELMGEKAKSMKDAADAAKMK